MSKQTAVDATKIATVAGGSRGLGRNAANRIARTGAPENHMKNSQMKVGPLELHVAELGEGRPVLFCHGFPDLWRGWRRQMEAVAAAGYRAIALDMRGYGKSTGPDDPHAYTPFHTVGDLVGLLDALELPAVTIVGHDFGAVTAWAAAMMRPDRFTAVFCLSVPYLAPGERSFLDDIRASGAKSFYMFDQMKPEADQAWADAKVTYPGFLYWSSATPAPADRWDPFAGGAAMVRKAPVDIPPWADPADVAYAVGEFARTGFRKPLHSYRSIQPYYDAATAFKGALVRQPSFFLIGEADALNRVAPITEEAMRPGLPGLRGFVRLPGAGHWPQQEMPAAVNEQLLRFLKGLA